MKPNAARMQAALTFVSAHPGTTMRAVIAHLLPSAGANSESTDPALQTKREGTAYRQAASVVERLIKDRHVCQAPDLTLRPWDDKRKAYAEALERAMFAADDAAERAALGQLACKAWRRAGDENRARTLYLLDRLLEPADAS